MVAGVCGGKQPGLSRVLAALVLVDGARASFNFPEVCYSGKPFAPVVRQTRNGATKEMSRTDPAWEGHFSLFTAKEP